MMVSLTQRNPETDLRFFTRQINPRSLGSWCVKGTEESTLKVGFSGLIFDFFFFKEQTNLYTFTMQITMEATSPHRRKCVLSKIKVQAFLHNVNL